MGKQKEFKWDLKDVEPPKAQRKRYQKIITGVLKHNTFKEKGRVQVISSVGTPTLYAGLKKAIKEMHMEDKLKLIQRKGKGVWILTPQKLAAMES